MILTSSERRRLSQLSFLVAWLFGSLALIAGFESVEGFLQSLGAAGAFTLACGLWYLGCKLSNFGVGAYIVVALWGGPLLGAPFDFHYYASQPFFWMYAAVWVAIICVLTVSQRRSVRSLRRPAGPEESSV